MFENSKWITKSPWTDWCYPERAEDFAPSPYITKDFLLDKPLEKAELNIVGLGQAAYYVNGKRIEESYLPTQPANYMKTVVYNTYDILPLLKSGKNRIGAILGNNGFCDMNVNRWRAQVKMIAELSLVYEDGTSDIIVSDNSWKTADSPILFSMRRCGENYDARLNISDWCNPDFDNSSWQNVGTCSGPGGILKKNICPDNLIKRGIKGKEIAKNLFDFGMSLSGWVEITVKGTKGNEIVVKYGERITDDKLHIDQRGILSAYEPMAHTSRYIIGSEDAEKWEEQFSYHGFRYVEIIGDYDYFDIEAVSAYTNIQQNSFFECDNEIINKIHSATVNSILTNCHGALLDCPHREQNEWTGDGCLSAESVNINFDAYNMFKSWMYIFKDDQFPDGRLPCIIPAKNWLWEYNFASGVDWESAIFHIPYYTFKYSGNPEIVELMWDNMNRSLKYFSTVSNNYLVRNGVGDWCALEETCDKEITDTAYYRIDALMMAEMADFIGKDGKSYMDLAEKIKNSFREKYVKNGKINDSHETALAAAIFAGFLTEDEAKNEAKRLADIIIKNDYRFTCGVHGLRFIFDVLSKYGYTQVLFDTVVNGKYPGYVMSLESGMNSLPERFDIERVHSQDSLNHHFRSPVDSWFYKYLAGIKLEGFGFEKVVISPQFVKGIDELKASFKGIKVEYNKETIKIISEYPFTLICGGINKQYPAGEYECNKELFN